MISLNRGEQNTSAWFKKQNRRNETKLRDRGTGCTGSAEAPETGEWRKKTRVKRGGNPKILNAPNVQTALPCLYINVYSLPNKIPELLHLVENAKPKIIGIVEAKLKSRRSSLRNSDFNIPGYDCAPLNIENNKGRGILLYAHTSLNGRN